MNEEVIGKYLKVIVQFGKDNNLNIFDSIKLSSVATATLIDLVYETKDRIPFDVLDEIRRKS